MAGYKTPAEAEAGGFSVTKTLFATPGAAVTGASIAAAVPKVMEGASPRDSLGLRRRQRGGCETIRTPVSPRTSPDP